MYIHVLMYKYMYKNVYAYRMLSSAHSTTINNFWHFKNEIFKKLELIRSEIQVPNANLVANMVNENGSRQMSNMNLAFSFIWNTKNVKNHGFPFHDAVVLLESQQA